MRTRVPREVREAIADLLAEYAMAIDEDRLEDWIELFDADGSYKVVTRENVEQDLPNILIWCANKDMLRDRVESVPQRERIQPALGPARLGRGGSGEAAVRGIVEACYSLFQTDLEGVSRLLRASGRYQATWGRSLAASRSSTRCVAVADTGAVPTLLATPVSVLAGGFARPLRPR